MELLNYKTNYTPFSQQDKVVLMRIDKKTNEMK